MKGKTVGGSINKGDEWEIVRSGWDTAGGFLWSEAATEAKEWLSRSTTVNHAIERTSPELEDHLVLNTLVVLQWNAVMACCWAVVAGVINWINWTGKEGKTDLAYSKWLYQKLNIQGEASLEEKNMVNSIFIILSSNCPLAMEVVMANQPSNTWIQRPQIGLTWKVNLIYGSQLLWFC